jgi:hypothetical protein
MEHYLAERYLAGRDGAGLAVDAARVRAAAKRVGRVRVVQTVYVPGDEVCFYLFESDSAELVGAVGRLARIDLDRVLPAVALVDEATKEDEA